MSQALLRGLFYVQLTVQLLSHGISVIELLYFLSWPSSLDPSSPPLSMALLLRGDCSPLAVALRSYPNIRFSNFSLPEYSMAASSSHLSCTTHDARSRVTKSTWVDGYVIVLIEIHALLVKPWPNSRKRYEFVRATTHAQQLGFSATVRHGCS